MPKLKALILTEGGRHKGFGHITRCLALKEALLEKGFEADLLVRGDQSVRNQFAGQVDAVTDWLKDSKFLSSRKAAAASLVVLDSYDAPPAFYRRLSTRFSLTLYVDDYLRISYPRGILLNGTLGAEHFPYPKHPERRMLLGSSYALLRKPFWRVRPKPPARTLKHILLSFGGTPTDDFLIRLVQDLTHFFPHLTFHLVLPAGVRFPLPRLPSARLRCYPARSARQMKELMLRCDAAISGCGQTLHELAACGLPVIGIRFADNQRRNIREWTRAGLLKFAGPADAKTLSRSLHRHLDDLKHQPTRTRLQQTARRLVDGQGARRTAGILRSCFKGPHD